MATFDLTRGLPNARGKPRGIPNSPSINPAVTMLSLQVGAQFVRQQFYYELVGFIATLLK